MKEEILKEYDDRLSKTLGGYCWMCDGGSGGYDYDDVKNLIGEMMDKVHNNALKMVEEGLGAERVRHLTDEEKLWHLGRNEYRQEVINNIQKLKI